MCCNFINLFPCILWDLIIMALVLSWWRLFKIVEFATSSQLAWDYSTHEGRLWSTFWKLKNLLCQCILRVTHDLAKSRSDSQNALIAHIFVTLPILTYTIYTLITHTILRVSQNLPFRESYSFSREKSL